MFYCYIFLCNDGTLYVGNINYPPQRGRTPQYPKMASQIGKFMVVAKSFTQSPTQTEAEAMYRETQVKKWSRIKKENLAKGLKP